MVRWCIRLTRLTLVCEVIRYRLVQVRQNQKKTFRVGGPQSPFSISSSFILSFVLLPFFLNTKIFQFVELVDGSSLWSFLGLFLYHRYDGHEFSSCSFRQLWLSFFQAAVDVVNLAELSSYEYRRRFLLDLFRNWSRASDADFLIFREISKQWLTYTQSGTKQFRLHLCSKVKLSYVAKSFSLRHERRPLCLAMLTFFQSRARFAALPRWKFLLFLQNNHDWTDRHFELFYYNDKATVNSALQHRRAVNVDSSFWSCCCGNFARALLRQDPPWGYFSHLWS